MQLMHLYNPHWEKADLQAPGRRRDPTAAGGGAGMNPLFTSFLAALATVGHPHHHLHVRHGLASWYEDSETLACARAADGLGVASLTVPCGRRVRLCYRGCVTATVDDHGPYITGRVFDLGPAVKARIRCPDLCHLTWRLSLR
jgi:hypothetical protein